MLMQNLNKMIYFNKANKDIQLIFYPILAFVSETVRNYRRAFLTYAAGRINLLDRILKNLDQLKFLGTHLY